MAYSAFSRLSLIAALAFTAFIAVNGTQVMHRPVNYKDALRTFKTEQSPKTNIIQKRAGNKVSFAYFTNWGIYGANFRSYTVRMLHDVI
jgi:chitinase